MIYSKIKRGTLLKAMLVIQALLFNLEAQNLVYNGYFEVYSTCPNNISQINYATGWINADSGSSPDYYNTCASIGSEVDVPYTVFGYQPDCCGGGGMPVYMLSIELFRIMHKTIYKQNCLIL